MKENDSSAESVSTEMVTVMELASASSTDSPNLRVRFSEPHRMTVRALKESTLKFVSSLISDRNLGAQEVCFIDQQDGMDMGGVVEIQDVLLDVAEHGGAAIVGLQAEQDRQVGVELDGPDRGVAHVEGAVEAGGQAVLQEAQQAAFAGAGLAGDGADAAGVDQQLSGGEVAFDGGQQVELVDRDLLGERQLGEVEVAQQFTVAVHRDGSWERSVSGLTVTREAASEAAAGGSGSSGGSARAAVAPAASGASSPEGSRRRSARRTRALA